MKNLNENQPNHIGQGKRPDQIAHSEAITTAGWMILAAMFLLSIILYLIR